MARNTKESEQEYRKWHGNNPKDSFFMEEKEYYEMLGQLLKGKKTVDIGGGYGSISHFSPDTVCVDFSQTALDIAKRNGIKNTVKADIHNLPFKDNEFDIAVSLGVFEHLENIDQAISEMVRVSRMQILIVHAALPFGIEKIRPFLNRIFGFKDQPIEKPQKKNKLIKKLKNNSARVLVEGVWNYIDLRWIHPKIPYGIIKWPSHHFLISIKTSNLERRFLKNIDKSKNQK